MEGTNKMRRATPMPPCSPTSPLGLFGAILQRNSTAPPAQGRTWGPHMTCRRETMRWPPPPCVACQHYPIARVLVPRRFRLCLWSRCTLLAPGRQVGRLHSLEHLSFVAAYSAQTRQDQAAQARGGGQVDRGCETKPSTDWMVVEIPRPQTRRTASLPPPPPPTYCHRSIDTTMDIHT